MEKNSSSFNDKKHRAYILKEVSWYQKQTFEQFWFQNRPPPYYCIKSRRGHFSSSFLIPLCLKHHLICCVLPFPKKPKLQYKILYAQSSNIINSTTHKTLPPGMLRIWLLSAFITRLYSNIWDYLSQIQLCSLCLYLLTESKLLTQCSLQIININVHITVFILFNRQGRRTLIRRTFLAALTYAEIIHIFLWKYSIQVSHLNRFTSASIY